MPTASYQSPAYRARGSPRGRIAAAGLSLAILAAIVLALLWVSGVRLPEPKDAAALATFDVVAGERAARSPARRITRADPRKRVPPPPSIRPPPPPPPLTLPGVLPLSKAEFAASDVGAARSPRAEPGQAAQLADADPGDGGADDGAGEAPGGQRLHNADWYREPTRAELVTYLPPRQQVGWGMIACRTIERYHVDDCREIGETPGSGIARALRRAAWQFLVRPPQIDGRPVIGSWVRIRFDLVQGVVR